MVSRGLRSGPFLAGVAMAVGLPIILGGAAAATGGNLGAVASRDPGTPTNTTPPEISDTEPKVGEPLSATSGVWTGADDVTWTFQWLMDGVAIDAGKQASYTPTAGTVGRKLTVAVSGTRDGESVGRAESAPTSAVQPGAIIVHEMPAIEHAGARLVGTTGTVDRGSWTPDGLVWSYVWVADGKAIPKSVTGARGPRYTYRPEDWGKSVGVRVSGERAGYVTERRYAIANVVQRRPSMSLTAKSLGSGKVKLTVKVVVAGTKRPAGAVDLTVDELLVARIPRLVDGVGSVVVSGVRPGVRRVHATYHGNRLVTFANRWRDVAVR